MSEVKLMWGEPRLGHEFQYYLAWKHRSILSGWRLRLSRKPFAGRAYNRAFKAWGRAVDRIKEHGQHSPLSHRALLRSIEGGEL